jgi:hypothetical protein
MANQSYRRIDIVKTGPELDPEPQSPFQYQPLDPDVDGIRLIILEPAESPLYKIQCVIKHVTFAEKPKYEALSYMWGDPSLRKEITLNGKSKSVNHNLLRALQTLRSSTRRTLWIDALCINQEDVVEKTKQLRIMPYIYQRAQTVVVSLNSWQTRQPAFVGSNALRKSEEDLELLAIPNLEAICRNDYWKRVW